MLLLGNAAWAMEASVSLPQEKIRLECMMIENPTQVIMDSAISLKVFTIEKSDIISFQYSDCEDVKTLRGILKQGVVITTSTTKHCISRVVLSK